MIVITGFGPFEGVSDNPAERVARALHRRKLGNHRVMGLVLPVSYRRAPSLTLACVEVTRPVAVIGFGVGRGSDVVRVETRAVSARSGEDIDGHTPEVDGPEVVEATAAVETLASCLGAELSTDAGTYVCNAWLHEVTQGTDVPTAFVHIPDAGVDVDRIAEGLAQWLESQEVHEDAYEDLPDDSTSEEPDDDFTSEEPTPV